jgi:hypothetical protein
MKSYRGILILLASFVFTAIGSVFKIKHAGLADAFLMLGVTAFVIGMVIIIRQAFKRN